MNRQGFSMARSAGDRVNREREAHATVAADSNSRVWIAWDVSMEDWGKHPEKGGTLHSDRQSDVACFADGKLRRVGADFMEA